MYRWDLLYRLYPLRRIIISGGGTVSPLPTERASATGPRRPYSTACHRWPHPVPFQVCWLEHPHAGTFNRFARGLSGSKAFCSPHSHRVCRLLRAPRTPPPTASEVCLPHSCCVCCLLRAPRLPSPRLFRLVRRSVPTRTGTPAAPTLCATCSLCRRTGLARHPPPLLPRGQPAHVLCRSLCSPAGLARHRPLFSLRHLVPPR